MWVDKLPQNIYFTSNKKKILIILLKNVFNDLNQNDLHGNSKLMYFVYLADHRSSGSSPLNNYTLTYKDKSAFFE